MNPRLLVLSGPQNGELFTLTRERVSLGRDTSNTIVTRDRSVSRRHCIIRSEAGQFTINDLGSRNGTSVNRVFVKSKVLEHADLISIGHSLFLFLIHEDITGHARDPVESKAETLVTQSTIRLPIKDPSELQEGIHVKHCMVGESHSLRHILQCIGKVAPTDATVLIRGESGTGKELAAQAIHRNSPRAAKPFVAINCAVLTEPLLESELFGHEKGSFTGAAARKRGKLEIADGGTVFLDEVGELAPALQAKLLRVLQTQEFERVGGTDSIRIDIRLIAATNGDLDHALKTGSLRRDLFFRLNVVSLTMPPLRERREDIPLLASYFAEQYSKRLKRRIVGISSEAGARLSHYPWPGNVRELQNAIEHAVVLGTSDVILAEDLPKAILEAESGGSSLIIAYDEAIKEAKKQIVLKALAQANGKYTEAAKILGIHPNHLHRVIRKMNLKTLIRKRSREFSDSNQRGDGDRGGTMLQA